MKKIPLLISVIMISLLLSFTACKNGEQDTSSTKDCAILSRSKIKNKWTDPKGIEYVVFFTNYHRISKQFKVTVQAFNSKHEPVGDLINLSMGSFKQCTEKLKNIAIPENIIDLKKLKIYDDKGNLIDFSHLKVEPLEYKGYLVYDITVIKDNQAIAKVDDPTLPCPPCYNCRPKPDDCEVPKDTTNGSNQQVIDTLQNTR